ncbi:hypothetical protein [Staphylococcus hyicus]|uniref:hypothetical protein n=1 Tax=Staphylococcus hyicus TaxID=1284 RepID=UPI003132A13F
MKKKTFIYVTFLIMIIVLSACGQDKTKESSSENTKKEVTLSDVLNGKQERKIIMTHDSEVYDSPDVMWAGTIGKGKVEIHPYYHLEKFEFNDIKDVSMKDYKDILKEKDKEYAAFPSNKNKKLNIKPVPAKTVLIKDRENPDKVKGIGLDYDAQYYSGEDEYEMLTRAYTETSKSEDKNWLTLTAYEKDKKKPYVINVEAKDDEYKFKFEDLDKVTKKYNNLIVMPEQ